MAATGKPPVILIAEGDADDRRFYKKAFAAARYAVHLIFVEDGAEAVDYLLRQGIYREPAASPTPDLVLLDLYLPRRDGKAVLRELHRHPKTRKIPVIVLTRSHTDEDLLESYRLGVNSYYAKPGSFGEWRQLIKQLGEYWIA